jgi:hypothetical protein
MSKLLVKLTFGITVTATVGFYYLAAAPPTLAQTNVCGVGNYSDSCRSDGQRMVPSTGSTTPTTTTTTTSTTSTTTYVLPTQNPTAVPEPSTVIAMLVTGAGIIFSGKKRKNVSEEP